MFHGSTRTVLGLATLGLFGWLAQPIAESPLPDKARLQSSPVLRHLKPNPLPAPAKTPGERTVAQMHVPEGFRVEVIAEEPAVRQPVAFAIDERGRLWVAEAFSYPQRQPEGKGLDELIILEDKDGDGQFETRTVFATGLNLVSGFEVGHGGVWVGAAPQLLFIPDANHDDIPDGPPQVLLEGFGYQDTHECLNSFLWGPDGWLYGIQGVFNFARIGKPGAPDSQRTELRAGVWRYHPRRHEFEVFAHGGSNPWGLDYDERGQLFMTHCRSYWGRGLTTHVIQGGQFWNQANANYPGYIIADPPKAYPDLKNYLLASARYDHGAGGAGAPGSDAIYGGHSHVGTMIYLGDNWPDSFRGRLFTHNLHGHQINQQINQRLGSGFDTVHAGQDMLFCTDPSYVAIDLQYGPDGAVYMIDWYDQQHCHNPITERWDRTNGRLYRMEHIAGYKPVKVNLAVASDNELVGLHEHKNQWYPRTARRLLAERSAARAIDANAVKRLNALVEPNHPLPVRLNALWTLHGLGLDAALQNRLLGDPEETMRAWAVQLGAESRQVSPELLERWLALARSDASPVVRLYLASALQRLSPEQGLKLGALLAAHGEDRMDRNLPSLLWHGLGALMASNPKAVLDVTTGSNIPNLRTWGRWQGALLGGDSLDRVLRETAALSGQELPRELAAVELAVLARPNSQAPDAWKTVGPTLYRIENPAVRHSAESIAAAFGDSSMFPKLREVLGQTSGPIEERQHAFRVLSRALDEASVPVFLGLLDQAAFRTRALSALGRFNKPEVAEGILKRYETFDAETKSTALSALTSRTPLALVLLKAVDEGRLKRDQLTAFHVRQLTGLGNADIDRQVAKSWGRIHQSPKEKQELVAKMEKVFSEAPLWAYDAREGRKHFQKVCASCHKLGPDGNQVGPELTGAGGHGIRYYLENIIDPDAVVGTDFQLTTIETKGGDTYSGLLASEDANAVTLRTVTEPVVVPKKDIKTRGTSDKSLMPEGLLEALTAREQLELLKYLTGS